MYIRHGLRCPCLHQTHTIHQNMSGSALVLILIPQIGSRAQNFNLLLISTETFTLPQKTKSSTIYGSLLSFFLLKPQFDDHMSNPPAVI